MVEAPSPQNALYGETKRIKSRERREGKRFSVREVFLCWKSYNLK